MQCECHEQVAGQRGDGTRPGVGTERHPEYLPIYCNRRQYTSSCSIHRDIPWEESTTELSLDEELAIHDRGGGVEGRARDGWVDIVLGGCGVSNQEPDGLELVELASVSQASQNLVDGVCRPKRSVCCRTCCCAAKLTERLRNEAVRSSLGRCWG